MGLVGYVARVLLIVVGASCGLVVMNLASMVYAEIALLFLAAATIPASMIFYEYLRERKSGKDDL